MQTGATMAVLREPFIAGVFENPAPFTHRLWKMEGGAIYLCHNGWGQIVIDLKEYEVTENSLLILLPNSIVRINGVSSDFKVSYFGFPKKMFDDSCIRIDPVFFQSIKKSPCCKLQPSDTESVTHLLQAATSVYKDKNNRCRIQIAENLLQAIILDIYDKCHQSLSQPLKGGSRQEEVFNTFISLVHEYCKQQREVTFYANKLCISPKYLTGICQSSVNCSAKKIIDDLTILEIKVLLQSSEPTLQAISDLFNFPDQSYLGRFFKRNEGMSPTEYRKLHVFKK